MLETAANGETVKAPAFSGAVSHFQAACEEQDGCSRYRAESDKLGWYRDTSPLAWGEVFFSWVSGNQLCTPLYGEFYGAQRAPLRYDQEVFNGNLSRTERAEGNVSLLL